MRGIFYSQQWEACCEDIGLSARRWDEIYRGVEWAVATNAEHFDIAQGTDLRVVLTDEFEDAPALVIYFTIDDDDQNCTMQWVELDPDADEQWDDDEENEEDDE